MPARFLTVMLFSSALANASPGQASAVWISESSTAEPGKPLHTAIRMVHDEGWHSYWINPGEAGIPTTVEWKLPAGWQHGGLCFPVPTRFISSGLSGFGYEGTLLLPVMLTPPEDFTGSIRLEAVVSWLACGNNGCVPGEARLQLELRAGKTVATDDRDAILSAHRQVPAPRAGVRLEVIEKQDLLTLTITHDEGFDADFSSSRVFPVTPELIDPKAGLRFKREGKKWTLAAPLGEFAQRPVRKLSLVLDGGGLETPLELTWSAPLEGD